MRLSSIKRISKEDMARQGEVPKWVDPMLDTLNDFIEKVTVAINGNLSFPDNFLCKEIEQEFEDGVELEINTKLDGRAQLRAYGVLPESTGGVELDALQWRILPSGNIAVTMIFGTSTKATCRILILLR